MYARRVCSAACVHLAQEDDDRCTALNVRLEQADVRQIVHVEEDADAGEQMPKLPLDHGTPERKDTWEVLYVGLPLGYCLVTADGALVLARRPYVREESVVSEPQLQRQLGQLVCAQLPHRSNPLLLGDQEVDHEQHGANGHEGEG